MILRAIEVRGWRCFADVARVGRFSEGINVVHGPNATGKSTLFHAMTRGFLDWHRVGGEEAESLRPWGRALAPVVTVEFRHGGREYRLTKRFLDRASSELERLEGSAFTRIAEGDAADEQLRGMLRASAPGRGLVQAKHWGVAQVLWTLQGDLQFEELSGDLAANIRGMLGASFAGPRGGRIEQGIEALYAQYFTLTGAVKKGQKAPEAVRLEEKLAQAREALQAARRDLEEFEARSRRIEDVRAEQAQLRREAEASGVALNAARGRAREYAAHSLERERRAGEARAAEVRYQQIVQRMDAIKSAAAELARAEGEREALAALLPDLARAAEACRAEALARKAALEDARAGQEAVDKARQEAQQAGRYSTSVRQKTDLSARLGEVREAESALAAVTMERSALAAPDAKALRAIRKAAQDRDQAQRSLEAALIHVEFVPERDAAVSVLEGEKRGAQKLAAGRPARFQGSPEVVLEIAGAGRLRASGPAGDAEGIRAERDRAIAKLARLVEPYGTGDLEKLESLNERAAELDGMAGRHQARLDGLLSGKTAGELAADVAVLETAIAEIQAQFPSWTAAPPDAPALADAARALDRSFRERVTRAESDWTTAEKAASEAENQEAREAARLEEVRKRIAEAQQRLSELRSDGLSDRARDEERGRAALAWDAARAALNDVQAKLAGYGGNPAEEADRLERLLAGAADRERDALAREKREEGALAELAGKAPYAAVARGEEQVAALTERLSREQARMQAVRLLWKTVEECRSRAVAQVAGPVEDAATAILQRIAGGRLGRIALNDSFAPRNLNTRLADVPVAVGDASGGEREQIFLATRLALAEILAREEPPLVVLDDVLTATDTGRFARAMRVLEEASGKMQIVILTCHPERYGALAGAEFFDLEQIAAAHKATGR